MDKESLIAMGLSEGQADSVMESLDGNYVTKSRFNEVNEENKRLKEAADGYSKQLEKTSKEHNKQLEELKKNLGDSEGLKEEITKLQDANREQKAAYENEMKELKLETAIKLAVAGKVHDEDIAASLFDKSKLILTDDGKVAGLDEQLKVIQEEKAFLFKEGPDGEKPKPAYKPKGGEPNDNSFASGFAEQRNEADRMGAQGSLWGAE